MTYIPQRFDYNLHKGTYRHAGKSNNRYTPGRSYRSALRVIHGNRHDRLYPCVL